MGLPYLESATSPGLGQRRKAMGGVLGDVLRFFSMRGVRSALMAFGRVAIGVRILLRELRWPFGMMMLLLLPAAIAVLVLPSTLGMTLPQAERLRRSRRARAECSGPGVRIALAERSMEPVYADMVLALLQLTAPPRLLSSVR